MRGSKLILGLVLLAAAGCNYEHRKLAPRPLGGQIDFALIQRNLLQMKCAPCHMGNAAGGIDLTSYAAIVARGLLVAGDPAKSQLYDSVAKRRMPKGNIEKLTADEMTMLATWIRMGAPEKPGSPPPPPPEPAPAPTPAWSYLGKWVFERRCNHCHSGTKPKGDLDMTTWAKLMDAFGVVDPGSPDTSSLYQMVRDDKMPPSPPFLEESVKNALRDWIAAGAEKN